MKKLKMVTVTIAAILMNAATAGTHTWKKTGSVNDWDWTNAGNFEEGAPTADGTAVVVIPESTTVRLLGTDANSLARFATLAGIGFDGRWDEPAKTSRLLIDSDSDLELAVPLCLKGLMNGEVIKRGNGMLSLTGDAVGVTTNFFTSFKIEGGTLTLPTASADCNFTTFTIASNATLRTVTGGGKTCCYGIWGDGTVTNTDTHGGREFRVRYYKKVPPCKFGGMFTYGIQFLSSTVIEMTGTNNFMGMSPGVPYTVFNESNAIGCSTNSFIRLGSLNERSSTGYGHLCYAERGGVFLYKGEGEETDKKINFRVPHSGAGTFDAGAVGGITFTGAWDINYSSVAANHGMGMFIITGSNTVPCVMNGTIPQTIDSNSKTCSLHIVKRGTGTWRLGDEDTRKGSTAFTIEEGTMQFDSLDLKGDPCSFGTADNPQSAYAGRYDASKTIPYAFLAGAPGKDATLELTGTRGAYSIGRLMGLNGDIRLKNDTQTAFRFAGVEPITDGGKTLRLAGSGTGENEIAGISDRAAAKISVVKEGSGTWTLSGSNSFTGKLIVNGGQLNIRSRAGDYTWYMLTIRSTVYNNTGCYPDWLPPLYTDSQYTDYFQMREWFLLDENHRRQNIGFTTCNTLASIQPGQIAYFGRFGVQGYEGKKSYTYPHLLCDAYAVGTDLGTQVKRAGKSAPKPDDPSTWLPFVLRITNGTPRIASYDFVIRRGTNSLASGYSLAGANVGSYKIEGSLDGLAWDVIDDVPNTMDPSAAYRVQKSESCTMSDPRSYTEARAAPGTVWECSPDFDCFSTASGSALDTVTSVTVASNALLAGIGDGVVIPGLDIDVATGGTISNCSFAVGGTLNVTGLGKMQSARLPVTFVDVRDLSNVDGWTLYEDGSQTIRHKFIVKDGGIEVHPIGFVVNIR